MLWVGVRRTSSSSRGILHREMGSKFEYLEIWKEQGRRAALNGSIRE